MNLALSLPSSRASFITFLLIHPKNPTDDSHFLRLKLPSRAGIGVSLLDFQQSYTLFGLLAAVAGRLPRGHLVFHDGHEDEDNTVDDVEGAGHPHHPETLS